VSHSVSDATVVGRIIVAAEQEESENNAHYLTSLNYSTIIDFTKIFDIV